METIARFPFTGIEFARDGAVADDAQLAAALDMVRTEHPTDLIVLAHGWNNDMADARRLYVSLLERIRASLDDKRVPGAADRRYAVLGVFWPSKKFAEKDLIPSGAAAIGSAVTDAALLAELEDLKGAFTDPAADAALEQAEALVPDLEDDPAARRRFADLLRSVLPQSDSDDEDASTKFFALDGAQLMDKLSKPPLQPPPTAGTGGAAGLAGGPPAGGAAGLGSFIAGVKGAARNLVNFATYYQMKERSGVVGRGGVHQVLQRLRTADPDLRLHLVGHSFGGRLVTAAAMGPDREPPVPVATATLLQAAYSHYGLAQDYEPHKDGLFRRLVTDGTVSGPVLITHSVNDKAVGLAYPLASLIAGQVAARIGDEHDRYGGMGRNGARKTPEASDGLLLDDAAGYRFVPGRIFNLDADAVIMGHSDICKDQVADAFLTAVVTT